MLFPAERDVPRVWEGVAMGTGRGELGVSAKVATRDEEDEEGRKGKPRLVCVYTKDFGDRVDVRRVVEGLVGRGLVEGGMGRAVYYKCGECEGLSADVRRQLTCLHNSYRCVHAPWHQRW